MRFCDVWIFDLVCIINTDSFICNSHICQSWWVVVVVVGGAAWMEEVGGVVVGWDR